MFTLVRRTAAVLATVIASVALSAAAHGLPIAGQPIRQADWPALKKTISLPSGLRIAYVELGDPKGPPLLLLHGYTDSSRSWSLLAPYLGRYRMIIPDQRGHGASDAPACCYHLTQLADDARQLLERLGIERAAVAGHSMGSMVAITMAANHPERVSTIALLGSTGLVAVRRGDWLWTNVEQLRWPLDTRTSFLREWHPGNQPTPVDRQFAEAAMADILTVKPHVWRGILRDLTDVPIARHAGDVRAPVLILSGGADPLFPREHHDALVKAFPGAEAHVYPHLGHNFLWEQPKEVVGALDSFFRR